MKLTPQILAFYLGCEAMYDDLKGKVVAINLNASLCTFELRPEIGQSIGLRVDQAKPILRRLESMTEEEEIESGIFHHPNAVELRWNTKQFAYLLSKSFDLFGLIDAGLAIEKKVNASG